MRITIKISRHLIKILMTHNFKQIIQLFGINCLIIKRFPRDDNESLHAILLSLLHPSRL